MCFIHVIWNVIKWGTAFFWCCLHFSANELTFVQEREATEKVETLLCLLSMEIMKQLHIQHLSYRTRPDSSTVRGWCVFSCT